MPKLSGRQYLIGAALAASALAAASPAAAQYYPQPQYNGYGSSYAADRYQAGYPNQYSHGNGRALYARVDLVSRRIDRLARSGRLSRQEANRLGSEAQWLRNRVQQAASNGVDPRERRNIEDRLIRLEQRVGTNANDGNDRYDRRPYGQTASEWHNGSGRWQDRDGRWHDGDEHREGDNRQ